MLSSPRDGCAARCLGNVSSREAAQAPGFFRVKKGFCQRDSHAFQTVVRVRCVSHDRSHGGSRSLRRPPRVGASQEAECMGRLLRRPAAGVREPALGLRTHTLGRLSRSSEEEACPRKAARRRVVCRRRGAGALASDPGDSWWGLPSPWSDVCRDGAGKPPVPVSHGEALGTHRGRPRTPGASKRLLHGRSKALRRERPAPQPGSSRFRERAGRDL